jgi:hypothetical protein
LSEIEQAAHTPGKNSQHEESPMNKTVANRRTFLEAVGALSVASIFAESVGSPGVFAAEGKQMLAIEGGTPVRKTPLHSRP